MARTLKQIYAGPLRVQALYSRCSPSDAPKVRQAKRQASSAAQRRMNQIYSYQQLELMLAVNFPTPGSGLVVVLTFDDAHMPKDRAAALQRLRYFRQKLTAERKTAGLPEPVIFWSPEVLTSATGRWHFHVVLDSTGRDAEMIRKCWGYGSDIEIKKLRVDAEKNHETLARYMTKELRECQDYTAKPGLRSWSCTRNARRPESDTQTVSDDFRLEPPAGAIVLIDERKTTEWASFRVLKFRMTGVFEPAPRARRRRSRRE